ncbi:MAG: tRNA-intron lyase [Nitrososphaeraceae archaeon]|nr:tRNA-intron lyase [Nitrososphaeraceae archaeon]
MSNDNETEFAFVIEGVITRNGVVVIESVKQQDQLRSKGYGEKIQDMYILESYEALFLLYSKRLIVKKNKTIVDFSNFLQTLLKKDLSIFTKFLIFRDLRARGYIAKEGFGFGNDFRVYERGEYSRKPAKYVIFGINEGISIKANLLYENIRSIEKMGKEAIIAVIERRGEIIYYKVNLKKFTKNIKLPQDKNTEK